MKCSIDDEILDVLKRLRKKCEKHNDESVFQYAKLRIQLRTLISKLKATGLSYYPRVNKMYHKVTDENLGTFIAVIGAIEGTRIPMLAIKQWDFKIHPQLFKEIYPLLLQVHPIYDKSIDGGCGMKKVTAPNGWENFIKPNGKPLSETWFDKAVPFNNQTQMAYVRDFNGNIAKLYLNGMLDYYLSNWEKHEAEGLLGEMRINKIDNIITEAINTYLRKNILLGK